MDPKKEAEDEKGGEEEEDEDAPPKVEIKQVQEDDAFYSIRYFAEDILLYVN